MISCMATLWQTIGPDRQTSRQLWRVAWPLIRNNSISTLQFILDRVFLSPFDACTYS